MACLSKNDTGFHEVSSLNFLYEIIVLIKTTADFQLILTCPSNSRSLSRHARGQSRDPRLCETFNSLVRPIHSLASRNAFLYSTINISTLCLNHKVLYNLFFVYFKECYDVDECLVYTFLNLSTATRKIYEQFAAIAI